ncbi:hypothetical protein, partial [Planktothrix sp.]|uniref:hypothetical protein n=1 Tax=Planktothrix sp. TaxID=3088171 RepID=UPI0038D40C4B
MELCRKPIVSACSPRDWVIGLDVEGVIFKEVTSNGTTPPVSPVVSQTNKIIFDYPTTGPNPAQFTNTDNPTTTGVLPSDLDSYQLAVLLAAGKATVKETTKQIQYNLYDWKENQNSTQQGIFIADKFLAGTTSRPARFVEDQGFPRRISFFRYANGKLLTNSSGQPVSIGMAPKPTGNSSTSNNQDEQHDILSCFVVDGNSLTLDFDTVGVNVPIGSDATGKQSTKPGKPNEVKEQECSNNTPRIRSTGNGL